MPALRKIGPIVLVLAVFCIIGAIISTMVIMDSMIDCRHVRRDVSKNGMGDTIQYDEELCDGLGGSDTVSIKLKAAPGGNDGVIFSYWDIGWEGRKNAKGGCTVWKTSESKVRWLNDATVLISVDDVDEIYTQRKHLGRIKIQYQIVNPAS